MFEAGDRFNFTFKGNRWAIRFSEDPRGMSGEPVRGIVMPGRREIDIRAGMTPQQTAENVVHELLHLCGWLGERPEVGMSLQAACASHQAYEFFITQSARTIVCVLAKLNLLNEMETSDGTHI